MKKNSIVLLILLHCGFSLWGQKDTTWVEGRIGLRGQWQTGLLNQFVINPNLQFNLNNKIIALETVANYEFLQVDAFNAINDFWSYVSLQYKPNKLIYPMVMGHFGFAKSYRLDHSLLGGVGAGVNLIKRKRYQYLQANLFVGYINFKFTNITAYQAPNAGAFLKMSLPLLKGVLRISWELHAYLSMLNAAYWGLDNRIGLAVQITKKFALHLSHNTIHNNITAPNISQTNTKLLFGLSYSFSNF